MKKIFLFATLALFVSIAAFAQDWYDIPIPPPPPDPSYNPPPSPPPFGPPSNHSEPPYQRLLYEVVGGRAVTITKYYGNASTLTIPAYINNLPVTSIRNEAFAVDMNMALRAYNKYVSTLTTIIIPSTIISIENNAFYDCDRLIDINVDKENPSYASIDGVLFDKNFRTLIKYPQNKNQKTYIIPSTVTSISEGAFFHCRNYLVSVTMPSSLRSIGKEAFFDCKSLTSVNIPSSVTFIDEGAFRYCESLTNITIPSSVKSIENGTFQGCESITNITIPTSVTSIGYLAFSRCSSLTSITIPSSVISIDWGAFSNCKYLTSITLSRHTQVGYNAFPETVHIIYRD